MLFIQFKHQRDECYPFVSSGNVIHRAENMLSETVLIFKSDTFGLLSIMVFESD